MKLIANDDDTPVIFPAELTPALEEVLGRTAHTLGHLAEAHRVMGADIAYRASDEQAYCLHWLIPFALKYGERWKEEAGAELKRLQEEFERREPGTNFGGFDNPENNGIN